MSSQSVASEEHIQIAGANHPADVLDTSRVDECRPQDGQDLFAVGFRPLHGGGNLAHRHSLGLFARHGAGHELEQVLTCGLIGGKDAESLSAYDDAIAFADIRHGEATSRSPFWVHQDATVHLLVFNLDPFSSQADLCSMIGGAIEAFG